MECKKIVILASLPEEIDVFKKVVQNYLWDNKEVILQIAGVGKASAAAVTQKMICEHRPDLVIYTGVGGALSRDLQIGDVGVVIAAIDSEMDARGFNPSMRLGQYPFSSRRILRTDDRIAKLALSNPLNIRTFEAYAATSSQFMDKSRKMRFSEETIPLLDADIGGKMILPNIVDMESVGFLTATELNGVPSLIIRTVANTLEGDAPKDLMRFLWDRTDTYLNLVGYVITNIEKI